MLALAGGERVRFTGAERWVQGGVTAPATLTHVWINKIKQAKTKKKGGGANAGREGAEVGG